MWNLLSNITTIFAPSPGKLHHRLTNILSNITMSATDQCAACGRGGDGLKRCNGCKLVKYCNATCQKAHRSQHKNDCKKRATELHDEALFREPPTTECPICFLPVPTLATQRKYQTCCGKLICIGCIHGVYTGDVRILCPFCRDPQPTSASDSFERMKKRAEQGDDAIAINQLGAHYHNGGGGLQRDDHKALGLFLRAGELGYAEAYHNVARVYYHGRGVERDAKKAKYYWELAAIGGNVDARHSLGVWEGKAGNMKRAVKHFMISAGAGHDDSLQKIRECFMRYGGATKDDFEKALRAHKEAKDEMKSDMREAAAAAV